MNILGLIEDGPGLMYFCWTILTIGSGTTGARIAKDKEWEVRDMFDYEVVVENCLNMAFFSWLLWEN